MAHGATKSMLGHLIDRAQALCGALLGTSAGWCSSHTGAGSRAGIIAPRVTHHVFQPPWRIRSARMGQADEIGGRRAAIMLPFGDLYAGEGVLIDDVPSRGIANSAFQVIQDSVITALSRKDANEFCEPLM